MSTKTESTDRDIPPATAALVAVLLFIAASVGYLAWNQQQTNSKARGVEYQACVNHWAATGEGNVRDC